LVQGWAGVRERSLGLERGRFAGSGRGVAGASGVTDGREAARDEEAPRGRNARSARTKGTCAWLLVVEKGE
jgi:hypothetical protein